jgi:hypothetical protein
MPEIWTALDAAFLVLAKFDLITGLSAEVDQQAAGDW